MLTNIPDITEELLAVSQGKTLVTTFYLYKVNRDSSRTFLGKLINDDGFMPTKGTEFVFTFGRFNTLYVEKPSGGTIFGNAYNVTLERVAT